MKKILLLPLMLISLSSCNSTSGTIKTTDISGSIQGSAPAGVIRMAFVPLSYRGVLLQDIAQYPITTFTTTSFSASLPTQPADVLYQTKMYVDTNANGRFDLGEPSTNTTNAFLYYSKDGAIAYGTSVKAGWNLLTWNNAGVSATQPPFTNYNLSW